ncbi:MAG: hypothetical protein M1839_006346 [Geoglossum umbratile]|nr:MAG: hypothetical protein M1839_006346 [Geoglossum umbratile]
MSHQGRGLSEEPGDQRSYVEVTRPIRLPDYDFDPVGYLPEFLYTSEYFAPPQARGGPDYDLDHVICILEFPYISKYFHRKLDESCLEDDLSAPAIDNSGEQLLKHVEYFPPPQAYTGLHYDFNPVGCILEFLYTGEYFHHKLDESRLEDDPSAPAIDNSSEQLLKHVWVSTTTLAPRAASSNSCIPVDPCTPANSCTPADTPFQAGQELPGRKPLCSHRRQLG